MRIRPMRLLIVIVLAAIATTLPPIKALAQNGPAKGERYLLILKPQKNGVPDLTDHDITAAGGKVDFRAEGRVDVTLPAPAVEALRKHGRVKYIQKATIGPPPPPAAASVVRLKPQALSLHPKAEATPPTWLSGTYLYDTSGNIYAIGIAGDTGAPPQHRYAYDNLSRLTTANTTATLQPNETFVYDDYGNMTSHTVGANTTNMSVVAATNRFTTGAPSPYQYDELGNLTADAEATYAYDPFSMLREKDYQYKMPEFYIYTASDERIGVKYSNLSDSVTTWSIRDFSGNVLRQFKGMDDQPVATWLWVEDYIYRDGQLLGAERVPEEGGRRHFHLDHLGSPRLVTSSDETLSKEMSEHDFAPFGMEVNPLWQETTGGFDREDPKRFTGHERDYAGDGQLQTTKYLDYMHARYYSPATGRFLSIDPLRGNPRNPQSLNRYTYVMNNSISYIDPQGLFTWRFWEWFRSEEQLPKPKSDKCYECWMYGVTPDITVHGKDPDPVTPKYSVIRIVDRPDYGTFTFGAGAIVGLSGHISVDRKMRLYVGAGPSLQTPGPVGSLTLGRLDRDNPTPPQIADVLSGGGWNVSAGAGPAWGRSYIGDIFLGFAGRQAATEAGWDFFPGAGVSWHYSGGPYNTPLTPADSR
jgi:RHS repeat-associated protein